MYTVTYHHKIPDDLSKLSSSQKVAIKKAIDEKLILNPQLFGKPLQFSLKGLRRLRVGDYRVVFLLTDKEIFIILIAHRSKVYSLMQKRK